MHAGVLASAPQSQGDYDGQELPVREVLGVPDLCVKPLQIKVLQWFREVGHGPALVEKDRSNPPGGCVTGEFQGVGHRWLDVIHPCEAPPLPVEESQQPIEG